LACEFLTQNADGPVRDGNDIPFTVGHQEQNDLGQASLQAIAVLAN
jgi:hypothetical protein